LSPYLEAKYTPLSTNKVPSPIHALNGSPNTHTPNNKVDKGPTIPVCEVSAAPIRSIANITISTGATVQAVALSKPHHQTSTGITVLSGRNKANCAKQQMQATEDAHPTNRIEPMRWTTSPLNIKYKA
jgi:hypothetical protein